jgi:uncharacterized protein (UPF0335 family)
MPDVGGIAGDRLRSFIERIERLEEEKRALNHDIKEVYAEAKGAGFDTRTVRQIIKIRRMDEDDLDEQEALLDIYKRALGMLVDTPLGDAAVERAKDGAMSVTISAEEFGKFADAIDRSKVLTRGKKTVERVSADGEAASA